MRPKWAAGSSSTQSGSIPGWNWLATPIVGDCGSRSSINILGLEDYLRGVLANEMFADPEGFKVQAVVCRTLALYVRDDQRRHAGDGFDLCAEGHCQVYHGVDSEIPLSDQAIRATRGEVLTFKGRPLLAAYHANAGGATDEVEDVWPGSIKQDFAYLSHVQSPFDRSAEKLPGYQWCYQWQRQISLHEVSDRLAARGQQVGEIGDLIVRRKTKSGRVRELEVVGTKGRAHVAGAARVADVLGMPSSKLELSKDGKRFTARGSGYGDGIGLSQHGALGMAWAGYHYREILGHYYRGAALTEDYGRGPSRLLIAPRLETENKPGAGANDKAGSG